MQGPITVTGADKESDLDAARWAAVEARREELVRLADRILRNRHDAEDVVQETLAAVWSRPLAPDNLEAYVRRAVYLNALKSRARRRGSVPLDDAPAGALADVPRDEDPFEIGPAELERALQGLPETQQAVIRMKYYLGFSFRQIGETLSISQNTVSSRCRYGLHALRKRLGKE